MVTMMKGEAWKGIMLACSRERPQLLKPDMPINIPSHLPSLEEKYNKGHLSQITGLPWLHGILFGHVVQVLRDIRPDTERTDDLPSQQISRHNVRQYAYRFVLDTSQLTALRSTRLAVSSMFHLQALLESSLAPAQHKDTDEDRTANDDEQPEKYLLRRAQLVEIDRVEPRLGHG
jgi:hypothetical protein